MPGIVDATWVIVPVAILLLVCCVRFLRVLYVNGTLSPEDVRVARAAHLVPLGVLVAVLVAEVLVFERIPALHAWLPAAMGLTAMLGAVFAVERARSAVLTQRAARDD